MQFTDTHCHLDFSVFDDCLPFVLRSARAKGVERFIVPSVSQSNWSRVQSLANDNTGVTAAFGLHPVFVTEHKHEHLQALERYLLVKPKSCVAVGEIGLDKRVGDYSAQQGYFNEQLRLAKRFALPVIIHSVRAHSDVISALKSEGITSGVVHAFSGSYEEAKTYIEQGFSLGFGSSVCRYPAGRSVDVLRKVPLDALVLETDSPDMYLPQSASRIGTPLDIPQIYQRICGIRKAKLNRLFEQIERNVSALFF